MYLCSAEYSPQREHTICATDPGLAINWPVVDGVTPRMSERDTAAPTLDQISASGLLPTWEETRTFIESLRAGSSSEPTSGRGSPCW
jgi:dTDP-4-dehydrorhamnose 3,5-epimerase